MGSDTWDILNIEMIRVLYYAAVRERTGTFETRVDEFAGTVAELLKHLDECHGIHVAGSSEAANSDPLSALIIMVNGRHIAHIGGLDASVSEGDIVSIFPLVGGG